MSEFDYRKFLAENKLTSVSKGRETGKAKILSEGIQIREGFDMDVDTEMDEANTQKDAYFKRKEREKRGNWGGSVGAFVEKHGEDLGRVGTNRQALVDYIETTMKPELNDEAKAYVDNLVATTKSSFKLLQALYNATMAGSGLSTGAGSLREDLNEYLTAKLDDGIELDSRDYKSVADLVQTRYGYRPGKAAVTHFWRWLEDIGLFGDYEMDKVDWSDEECFDYYFSSEKGKKKDPKDADTGDYAWNDLYESITVSKKYPQEKGSRTSVTSKKYRGKKAGDGQDRMSKSEITGEKMDVTIGGVTKSISTRAYNKYRKMTDPEEKKAWKKKHGFIQ